MKISSVLLSCVTVASVVLLLLCCGAIEQKVAYAGGHQSFESHSVQMTQSVIFGREPVFVQRQVLSPFRANRIARRAGFGSAGGFGLFGRGVSFGSAGTYQSFHSSSYGSAGNAPTFSYGSAGNGNGFSVIEAPSESDSGIEGQSLD